MLMLLGAATVTTAKDIVWYNGKGCITYSYTGKKSAVVETALDMFEHDMKAVTGHKAENRTGAMIEIFELNRMKDKDFRKLQRRGVPIDRIIAKADAFSISTDRGHIIVMGSDANGTAYGILELSRMAGVSPWTWWGDVTPMRKHYLALPDDFLTIQWPTVASRGFTVHDPSLDRHQLQRLLLRLRGNTLNPGKARPHESVHIDIKEQWLPSTQPGYVYAGLKRAYQAGAHDEWIADIHHPHTVAYQLSLFMDMAWNINAVTGTNLHSHFRDWLCQQFDEQAGTRLLPVLTEYYHLTGIRKPEQMDVEFMADAFGNELERYIANYADLTEAITAVAPYVAAERKKAFFGFAEYPVRAAWLMAIKQLQAQEARLIGRPQSFVRDDEALASAVKSSNAHRRLLALCDTFAGAYKEQMPHAATALPAIVTATPVFPAPLPEEALTRFAVQKAVPFNFDTGNTVTRNACSYRRASAGTTTVAMLGHSMKAVALPKSGMLSYAFFSELQGEATVRVAVVPISGYGNKDITLSVQIDKEKAQLFTIKAKDDSPQWQTALKRGQIIVELATTLTRNSHDIEIRAIDSPVIIDQIMVDYDSERRFYIFPVAPEQL